jgi:hypothetical protein
VRSLRAAARRKWLPLRRHGRSSLVGPARASSGLWQRYAQSRVGLPTLVDRKNCVVG